MAEDTAVLDMPDTGIPEEQAPADEPETEALLDSPETEQADSDGPETEPETISREEAERLKAEAVEAAKAELKAQQEAERAEAITKFQQAERAKRIDQAARDRQGAALQSVASIAAFVAKEVDEGRLTPANLAQGLNPKVLENIAVRLDSMSFEHINSAHEETYDNYLASKYPGFAIPSDLARQRERAVAANDWEGIATSKLAILEAALATKVEAKVRAEVEAELADKQKTDATKANEAKPKRSGPTGVTGAAPVGGSNRAVLDSASPMSAEYRRAYRAEYGIDPPA